MKANATGSRRGDDGAQDICEADLDIDLDRAQWDPEYRRRALEALRRLRLGVGGRSSLAEPTDSNEICS